MKKLLLLLIVLASSAHAQIKAGDDPKIILNEALKNMTAAKPSPSLTPETDAALAVATAPTAHANDVWDFMPVPATHKECIVPPHVTNPYGDSYGNDAAFKIWTTKNHETILAYMIMQEGRNLPSTQGLWDDLFQTLTQKGEVWTLVPGTHVFLERSFPDGTGIITWMDRAAKSHTTYIALKDLFKSEIQ